MEVNLTCRLDLLQQTAFEGNNLLEATSAAGSAAGRGLGDSLNVLAQKTDAAVIRSM